MKRKQIKRKQTKKLKKVIANAMLYTICWRNVDKLNDLWVYDRNNIKLGRRGRKMTIELALFFYRGGICTILDGDKNKVKTFDDED